MTNINDWLRANPVGAEPDDDEDEAPTLESTALSALDLSPDDVASQRRVANEAGVSPVLGAEPLTQRAADVRRLRDLQATNPRLAAWMAQPDNYAIARDDVDALSIFERLQADITTGNIYRRMGPEIGDIAAAATLPINPLGAGGYIAGRQDQGDPLGAEQARQGELDVEYGQLAYRSQQAARGRDSLNEQERVRLEELATRDGQENWGPFLIGPTRRLIPQVVNTIRQGVEEIPRGFEETARQVRGDPLFNFRVEMGPLRPNITITPADNARARRVLGGQTDAGGVLTELTGEAVSVPFGVFGAFGRGAGGYISAGYEMETGIAFDAMIRQGIEPNIAADRAEQYGAWATAIEFASDALGLRISGATRLLTRATLGERVLAQRPIVRAVEGVVGTGLEQGTEEAAQEYAQIIHQDLARQDQENGNTDSSRVRWSEVLTEDHIAQILQAGYIGFQGGLGMGSIPSGANFALDMRAMREGDQYASRVEHQIRASQASRLNERGLPSSLESAVGAMDESNIYIDADRFVEHFQSAGANAYAVADELGISEQTLATALASHGQVEIPTARFAARVLRVPQHASLAEHARIAPDAYTPAEVKIADQRIQAAVERIAADADITQADNEIGTLVETRVRELLSAAEQEGGPRPEVAARVAKLYSSLARTLTARARAVNPAYAERLEQGFRRFAEERFDIAGPTRGLEASGDEVQQRGTGPEAGPTRSARWDIPEGVKLTERKRKIAEAAVNGASNEWIAEEWETDANTIAVTLSQIKRALGGNAPWEAAKKPGGRPGAVPIERLVQLRKQLRMAGHNRINSTIAERTNTTPANVKVRLWKYDRDNHVGGELNQFAGERARDYDEERLLRAEEMEELGYTPNEIWRETGWWRNKADGKWRYEINDENVEFINATALATRGTDDGSLIDVLRFPELFAAYPQLADLGVGITVDPSFDGPGGAYDSEANVITADGPDLPSAMSALLHEVQHAIQTIEGFANGGSVKGAREYVFEYMDAMESVRKEMVDQWFEGDRQAYEVNEANKPELYWKVENGIQEEAAIRVYMRLAGEIEARNVQRRRGEYLQGASKITGEARVEPSSRLGAEERKATDPSQTVDLPLNQAILPFDFQDGARLVAIRSVAREAGSEIGSVLGKPPRAPRKARGEGQAVRGEGPTATSEANAPAPGRTLNELAAELAQAAGEVTQGQEKGATRAYQEGEFPEGVRPYGMEAFRPGEFGEALIRLTESHDLSTFLHESGHLFHNILESIGTDQNAPEELRGLWQSTLDWWGVDQATWASMPREARVRYYEQWAETFERYLMEGEAPSLALREVFATFKQWLLDVYRSVLRFAGLNPNASLTPEIRDVFDRLLATDAEITEARAHMGADFRLAREAFKTEAEYLAVEDAIRIAQEAQEAELRARAMGAYIRQSKRWWRGERQRVRQTAAHTVDSAPARRVEQWIGLAEWRDLASTEGVEETTGYVAPENALEAMPEGLPPMQLDGEAIAREWPEAQLPVAVQPRTDIEAVLAEAMQLKAQEKGRGRQRAQRLSSFIKKAGGINLSGLTEEQRAQFAGIARRRPGLINNATGKTPEELMRLATEAGYFGEGAARELKQFERRTVPDAGPSRGGRAPRATQRFEVGGQRYRVEIDQDDAANAAVVNFRRIEQGDGADGANAYAPTGDGGTSARRVFGEVMATVRRDIAEHGRPRYGFVGDSARQSELYHTMARATEPPSGYRWSEPDSAGMIFLERNAARTAPDGGPVQAGRALRREVFDVPQAGGDLQVIRNPAESDARRIIAAAQREHGQPVVRYVRDSNGNLFIADGNRTTHAAMRDQMAERGGLGALSEEGNGFIVLRDGELRYYAVKGDGVERPAIDLLRTAPNARPVQAGRFTDRSVNSGGRLRSLSDDRGGFIEYVPGENGDWRVNRSQVPDGERGQGRGVALYEELIRRAREAGATVVRSDANVSGDAQNVYASLRRRGYDVRDVQHPGYPVAEHGQQHEILLTRNGPNAGPRHPGFEVFQGRAPIFESAALRAVERSTTNRASAQQWLATIQKTPGVKKEELEWIGLADWLNAQTGLVSREDVLAFVRENGVRVEETVLGGEGASQDIQRQLLPLLEERDRLLADENRYGKSEERVLRIREITPEIERLYAQRTESGTKWSQYTLPGGSNYRELLLRLPPNDMAPSAAEIAEAKRIAEQNGDDWEALGPNGRQRYHDLAARKIDTNFRSSHFDAPNILAHIRFNERTDSSGRRTLFIEEVQSDWHQGGRERGYGRPATTGWRAERAASGDRWLVFDQDGQMIDSTGTQFDATPEAAIEAVAVRQSLRAVPDAPFKNNAWASLAMKRMIRWAAENGFDQIAWTRGQHQVERFNLAEHIETIRAGVGAYKDSYHVIVDGRDGRNVLPDGRGGRVRSSEMNRAQIVETFGKDLGERLVQGADNYKSRDGMFEVSGDGLQIGGEGMRAFYDRILPNIANDLGKKYGARVGEAQISIGPDAIEAVARQAEQTAAEREAQGEIGDARDWRDQAEEDRQRPPSTETVHSLPITPEMREAVTQRGQELFQPGDKAPTVEEFLSTLISDLNNERQVYSSKDGSALASAQALSDAQAWFDAHDIDLSKSKDDLRAQIASAIEADAKSDSRWHPDDIAPWFGFSSGDKLIQALSALKPRAVAIEEEIDSLLAKEHGDAGSRENIEAQARLAAHVEAQAHRIELELAALEVATSGKKRPVSAAARAYAEQQVSRMTVKQVRGYDQFLAGERRAARNAAEAAEKGDTLNAAMWKQRQLISFHLYRIARDAAEEMDKAQTYFQKFDRDTIRAKIHAPLLDQIDQALEGVDLRRAPRISDKKRQSFMAWFNEMQAEGLEHMVMVDPEFLEAVRQRPFNALTLEEARGMRDAVRNFEFIGKRWREVLDARDARLLDEQVGEMVSYMDGIQPIEFVNKADHSAGIVERIDRRRQEAHAVNTRPEFAFFAMDGHKYGGPMQQALIRPMRDARGREENRQDDAQRVFEQLLSTYSSEERADMWTTKRYYPMMPNRDGSGMGRNFTKQEILAIALNTGNSYNFGALIEGEARSSRTTETQIRALLDQAMTARDWRFVQSVWDYVNSFWPEIAALYEKTTGVVPPKVEATPFVNRHGEWAGGYYPLKYDFGRDQRAHDEFEFGKVQEAFGGFRARTQTPNGFTKARQGSGGRPVLLDLSVVTSHVTAVIHDLEFRVPVLNAWRIIKHPAFAAAFTRAAGVAQYNELKPWLQYIATERMPPENAISGVIRGLRRNTPIVLMGAAASTIAQQPAGILGTMHKLGAARVALSAVEQLARFWEWPARLQFIDERSNFMRHLAQISQREMREMAASVNSQAHLDAIRMLATGTPQQKLRALGIIRDVIGKTSLLPMAFVNKWTASIPWMVAYQDAMGGKVENVDPANEEDAIAYADHVISTTFGSGRPEDMARIMRDGEVGKLITTAFSYFSTQYNQLYNDQIPGMMRGKISPTEFMTFILLTLAVQQLVSTWLAGRWEPDDDEDPEEHRNTIIADVMTTPFAGMPILRDLTRAFGRRVAGQKGSVAAASIPAFEAINVTATAAGGLYDSAAAAVNGEDAALDRKTAKAVVMAAGYWFGLPSRQIWTTSSYISDVATGLEDPADDPLDALQEGLLRDSR